MLTSRDPGTYGYFNEIACKCLVGCFLSTMIFRLQEHCVCFPTTMAFLLEGQVSDGQRRRVQLLLGLVKPFKLLLLDEVTTSLGTRKAAVGLDSPPCTRKFPVKLYT